MAPPVVWLVIVVVGASLLGTGFLMPEIGWFNLQGVSVNERDFSAPLSHANVDIEISKREALVAGGISVFKNLISACSFHTPDPGGLGPGSTVICKLTDFQQNVVAEGRADFEDGLPKSERTIIEITQTAFELANEVQNINDIKLIVLGGDPTAHICNQLMSDTCIDFDGVASAGRGLNAANQESFLGAPLRVLLGDAGNPNGLDWFDADADGVHDVGWDAFHVEDNRAADNLGNLVCPNAIRDAVHQPNADCVVIDISLMLQLGDAVSVDFEGSADFAGNGLPVGFAYHDDDGSLHWDVGEDIFLDGNLNGILD